MNVQGLISDINRDVALDIEGKITSKLRSIASAGKTLEKYNISHEVPYELIKASPEEIKNMVLNWRDGINTAA